MFKTLFVMVLFGLASFITSAAGSYASGSISNLTVTRSGIMIQLTSNLPDNCDGTPYGWILVKQENTAITSVILALWVSKNTYGTFYTSGRENGTGYCLLNQYDPTN